MGQAHDGYQSWPGYEPAMTWAGSPPPRTGDPLSMVAGQWCRPILASRQRGVVGKQCLGQHNRARNPPGAGMRRGAHCEGSPWRWWLGGGARCGWRGQVGGGVTEGVAEVCEAGVMLGEVTAGSEMTGGGLFVWVWSKRWMAERRQKSTRSRGKMENEEEQVLRFAMNTWGDKAVAVGGHGRARGAALSWLRWPVSEHGDWQRRAHGHGLLAHSKQRWDGTLAVGRALFHGVIFFSDIFTTPNLQNTKLVPLVLQNFKTSPGGR
jgi:hypothetical protein